MNITLRTSSRKTVCQCYVMIHSPLHPIPHPPVRRLVILIQSDTLQPFTPQDTNPSCIIKSTASAFLSLSLSLSLPLAHSTTFNVLSALLISPTIAQSFQTPMENYHLGLHPRIMYSSPQEYCFKTFSLAYITNTGESVLLNFVSDRHWAATYCTQ